MFKTSHIIIIITLITIYTSQKPSFEIKKVIHEKSRCIYENSLYTFTFSGTATNITSPIKLYLHLLQPENYIAICVIDPPSSSEDSTTTMDCTLDSLMYDLSGQKKVVVPLEEPIYDFIELKNWNKTFGIDTQVINSATNCDPGNFDGFVFAAFDIKNINVLGCFRKKINFSFEVKKLRSIKDLKDENLFFNILFENPQNEKAKCVVSLKNNGKYVVNCELENSTLLEIGDVKGEIIGNDKLNGKIIWIRGGLKPFINLDSC